MENIRLEDFARREILSLRQNLISKIMEYEKDLIYKKYENNVGELITGEVTQVWRKEVLVADEEGIELVLPNQNRFPPTTTRKATPSPPLWKELRSSPPPRASPCLAPPRCSSNVCWNAKLTKSATASSQSRTWFAPPVKEPRCWLYPTTIASTQWALAWD